MMQRRGVPPIRMGVVELTRCAAAAAVATGVPAAADREAVMLDLSGVFTPALERLAGSGCATREAIPPSWSDCGRRCKKRLCTVRSCSRSRSTEIALCGPEVEAS